MPTTWIAQSGRASDQESESRGFDSRSKPPCTTRGLAPHGLRPALLGDSRIRGFGCRFNGHQAATSTGPGPRPRQRPARAGIAALPTRRARHPRHAARTRALDLRPEGGGANPSLRGIAACWPCALLIHRSPLQVPEGTEAAHSPARRPRACGDPVGHPVTARKCSHASDANRRCSSTGSRPARG